MDHSQPQLISNTRPQHRLKGFFARFYELCKKRNVQPPPEIKEKLKSVLDFWVDRIKLDDWPTIMKSLNTDEGLMCIAIKARKACTHGIKLFLIKHLLCNNNFFFFSSSRKSGH